MNRWVRLLVPEPWERAFLGDAPLVVDEAPKGVGREVRLATEQDVGVLVRATLPKPEPKC